MLIRKHNPVLIIAFLATFLCLLAWNLGARSIPAPTLQVTGTNTPTEEISQSKEPEIALPNLTYIPTSTLSSEVTVFSTTPTPTIEGVTPVTNARPLPAIFATGAYARNELIVRFKASTRAARINECLQGVDVGIQSRIEELQAMVLKVNSEDVAGIFNHVLNCAGVLYVEPNFLL